MSSNDPILLLLKYYVSRQISLVKWAFESLAINEFSGRTFECPSGSLSCITTGQQVDIGCCLYMYTHTCVAIWIQWSYARHPLLSKALSSPTISCFHVPPSPVLMPCCPFLQSAGVGPAVVRGHEQVGVHRGAGGPVRGLQPASLPHPPIQRHQVRLIITFFIIHTRSFICTSHLPQRPCNGPPDWARSC